MSGGGGYIPVETSGSHLLLGVGGDGLPLASPGGYAATGDGLRFAKFTHEMDDHFLLEESFQLTFDVVTNPEDETLQEFKHNWTDDWTNTVFGAQDNQERHFGYGGPCNQSCVKSRKRFKLKVT